MSKIPPAQKDYPPLPLDKEIAQRYVQFLVQSQRDDDPEARRAFCEAQGFHQKLLHNNPHIAAIEKLFQDQSSMERLGDMTLRDYMMYHYYYIHQGYRYGAPRHQQRWLGHDIIKTPQDCWVYQEIIHETKPDVVIELGIMFGGATHFFASILDLVGHGEVLGIDISLAKAKPPENKRITYIEGSSTSEGVLEQVRRKAAGKRVLVIADSDHEKNHVLGEIRAYAPFVHVGGYFIVEDSLNDVMGYHPVPNEGPKAAAEAFLRESDDFVYDRRWGERYIMSLNPNGVLLRVK
ncbi:CmcI family methyltransferase [Dongia sp.]|uniref:CmcI family methyltransferase n=1 Tax=Dongia sp. TaxID=1977262 RepID=UPI0035B14631